VHTTAQHVDVVGHLGAADARVGDDVEVVADGAHDLVRLVGELASRREDERLALLHAQVHALQDADGERGGLAGARLGLGDGVEPSDDGHDAALLNGGRLLETVRVDAAKEVLLELHFVKGGACLVPVGLRDVSGRDVF